MKNATTKVVGVIRVVFTEFDKAPADIESASFCSPVMKILAKIVFRFRRGLCPTDKAGQIQCKRRLKMTTGANRGFDLPLPARVATLSIRETLCL